MTPYQRWQQAGLTRDATARLEAAQDHEHASIMRYRTEREQHALRYGYARAQVMSECRRKLEKAMEKTA